MGWRWFGEFGDASTGGQAHRLGAKRREGHFARCANNFSLVEMVIAGKVPEPDAMRTAGKGKTTDDRILGPIMAGHIGGVPFHLDNRPQKVVEIVKGV